VQLKTDDIAHGPVFFWGVRKALMRLTANAGLSTAPCTLTMAFGDRRRPILPRQSDSDSQVREECMARPVLRASSLHSFCAGKSVLVIDFAMDAFCKKLHPFETAASFPI
jgi:hypothetical protein